MHNKFFIFDNHIVFTGSANISSSCLTGFNSNAAIIIRSSDIANIYKQEFEQMYSGKFHTDKTAILNNENIDLEHMYISIYFSPADKTIINNIIPLVKEAKNYIYIPAFYITHPLLVDELINAKQNGVDVKIIVDETSVKGEYVDINKFKENNIQIKVENWAGKMHMKSIIIDDNTLVILIP